MVFETTKQIGRSNYASQLNTFYSNNVIIKVESLKNRFFHMEKNNVHVENKCYK